MEKSRTELVELSTIQSDPAFHHYIQHIEQHRLTRNFMIDAGIIPEKKCQEELKDIKNYSSSDLQHKFTVCMSDAQSLLNTKKKFVDDFAKKWGEASEVLKNGELKCIQKNLSTSEYKECREQVYFDVIAQKSKLINEITQKSLDLDL